MNRRTDVSSTMMCAVQVDRNDDMLRSCLRAIDAISRIPDAESVASFKALLQVLQAPCTHLVAGTAL